METASLFIGADNDTGEIDLVTVRTILDKRFDSFTMLTGEGCWHGQSEPCVMCVVTGSVTDITDTARLLKSELRQDAIGVQFTSPIQLI